MSPLLNAGAHSAHYNLSLVPPPASVSARQSCREVKQIQGFIVLSPSNTHLIFHCRQLLATLTFSSREAAATR